MARSLKISQVLPTLNLLRPVKFGALLKGRFCVDATAPVGEAAQKMAQERLTFVMVCEPTTEKNAPAHVLGMMTERDFMRYMTYANQHTFFSGQHPLDKRVSQVMTPLGRMTQLHPNTSVNAALRSIQHRIWRHLPVVDGPPGKEVLSSIVSIRDLILVADGGRTEEAVPAALNEPEPTTLHSVWSGQTAADVLASKRELTEEKSLRSWLLARSHRHTIGEHASVLAAAKQMERENLTFLVVVRDHEGGSEDDCTESDVVGLVTERSFLNYCIHPQCAPGDMTCLRDSYGDETTDLDKHAVLDLMTPLRDVVSVGPSASVSECVDIFFNKNVRHIPVFDALDAGKRQFIGVISLRDILRPIIDRPAI